LIAAGKKRSAQEEAHRYSIEDSKAVGLALRLLNGRPSTNRLILDLQSKITNHQSIMNRLIPQLFPLPDP